MKKNKDYTIEDVTEVLETKGIYEASKQFPDIDFTSGDEKHETGIICDVNNRIKKLRLENRLTQDNMAKILDTSQRQYWRYEQEGYNMNIATLAYIAMFYNISMDWISGFSDERKPFSNATDNIVVNGYSLKAVKEAKKNKIPIEQIKEDYTQ